MQYREIQPGRLLSPFIECFWTLEGEPDPSESTPERILPDGCVEIILSFADRFAEIGELSEEKLQPCHFLVGQMTRPVIIKATGSVRLIGIRFHPGGTFPFVRVPMHEVTDQIIELGAIAADLEREFIAAAESDASLQMKIAAIERMLARRLRSCGHDSPIVDLTARIIGTAGRVPLDTLAAEAGLSTRQLRRRFLMEVGVGPKLLCRLLRFQQVFRAVDENVAEWAGIAFECGYYDQAHLINDFRQFAQQTPSVLLANSSGLTEAFTRKHRASDFSNLRNVAAV
jgi:AraC-like DNA-binding protein